MADGCWIEVSLLDVGEAGEEASYAGLLDTTERARAERILDPLARRRYVIRRGWLRLALARRLGQPPDALAFTSNRWGKPRLDRGPCFSLSHSHGLALLAVGGDLEVGCDLERRDPRFAHAGLAARYFTPREAAALAALPPDAFFACWTCKEAFVKAKGAGLQLALDSFEVDLSCPRQPRLGAGAEGWSARAFEPAPGYQACVVAPSAAWRLRRAKPLVTSDPPDSVPPRRRSSVRPFR